MQIYQVMGLHAVSNSNSWTADPQEVGSVHRYGCAHTRIYDEFSSLFSEQPANNQGQSTLQPLPPPHKQHSAQHHPSITSLNRNSLTNRRNQSPAPPAALPAELQTTPESVQLQDSWVLGSNVPLESR